MPDTFTPPRAPSVGGVSRQTTPRALIAEFGDGYTQRAGDGLNVLGKKVAVSWNALTVEDANTIDSFLETQKGYLMFYWTDPREADPRKWICRDWTRPSPGIHDAISATFEEVFDI